MCSVQAPQAVWLHISRSVCSIAWLVKIAISQVNPMRIRQIDFPPAVIEAQRSGRLVLFAGAGVSIDPPSNYPDFKALASEVGGALHPRYEGEAIDVYLGRLKASGIRVHEQVRQILSSPNSRPNANHTALTGLFKDPKCCQLVTTNFDRRFTTAAADRFGKNWRACG